MIPPHAQFASEGRILALDIRPSKFGFVVFEGPTVILDCGVRHFSSVGTRSRPILKKRISGLLDFYVPTILIFRRRHGFSTDKMRNAVWSAVRVINRAATVRDITVESIHTRKIWRFFAAFGCLNKDQIASTLAEQFEILARKLPRDRKPWQAEKHNMVIFDAAAAAVALFATPRKPVVGI